MVRGKKVGTPMLSVSVTARIGKLCVARFREYAYNYAESMRKPPQAYVTVAFWER